MRVLRNLEPDTSRSVLGGARRTAFGGLPATDSCPLQEVPSTSAGGAVSQSGPAGKMRGRHATRKYDLWTRQEERALFDAVRVRTETPRAEPLLPATPRLQRSARLQRSRAHAPGRSQELGCVPQEYEQLAARVKTKTKGQARTARPRPPPAVAAPAESLAPSPLSTLRIILQLPLRPARGRHWGRRVACAGTGNPTQPLGQAASGASATDTPCLSGEGVLQAARREDQQDPQPGRAVCVGGPGGGRCTCVSAAAPAMASAPSSPSPAFTLRYSYRRVPPAGLPFRGARLCELVFSCSVLTPARSLRAQ